MDGDFDAPTRKDAPKGERAPTKKYPDNLKMNGDFDEVPKEPAPRG